MKISGEKIGVITCSASLVEFLDECLGAQVYAAKLENDFVDMMDLFYLFKDFLKDGCRQLILDCKEIREISTLGWAYLMLLAKDGNKVVVINSNPETSQRINLLNSDYQTANVNKLRLFNGVMNAERLCLALMVR